jgi:phosphatidylserine/phosphatidylglycerophosphate/cardiolipin synthase-like enzyme
MTSENSRTMPRITSAKAYANNEISLVVWSLDAPIPGCLGFELTRIYVDDGTEVVLAAWVPFKDQSNPDWKPQNTRVWPVQKLFWRDLTVRKRRDATARRPGNVRVKYRIRAMVRAKDGHPAISDLPEKTYLGDPLPLAYFDEGIVTDEVMVTGEFGGIQSAFTNGILSAQWLKHALEEGGEALTKPAVRAHIETEGDRIRQYLTGDVLPLLRALFKRATKEPGSRLCLALYELGDDELTKLITEHSAIVDVVLANSSKPRGGTDWDHGNAGNRQKVRDALGEHLTDRMFNNNRIGHNKFAVFLDAASAPQAVFTGSTNWTSTGLCGQSNNALLIDSPEVAAAYHEYWKNLKDDTVAFERPEPLSAGTKNAQSPALRTANATPQEEIILEDGTGVTVWQSPNTKRTTKGTEVPPDLAAVFSLMRKARRAILFAVFMPSVKGADSIVAQAVELGRLDPSLLVYGAVSDPKVLPNYEAAEAQSDDDAEVGAPAVHRPEIATFDERNVHLVRAAALEKGDLVADFEAELLTLGQAIIHDKIVVVDPLEPDGFIVTGSHNLGFKASYMNDENLVIIRNNPGLIKAYAVHVLDLYEHYRFRAVQAQRQRDGEQVDEMAGFLSRDDAWLERWVSTEQGDLARYLAE